MDVGGSGALIENNTIRNATFGGIQLGGTSRNVLVQGNNISNLTNGWAVFSAIGGPMDNVTIRNNNATGLRGAIGIGSLFGANITIEGNNITDVEGDDAAGIFTILGDHHRLLRNNVSGLRANSSAIGIGSLFGTNLTVEGNNVTDVVGNATLGVGVVTGINHRFLDNRVSGLRGNLSLGFGLLGLPPFGGPFAGTENYTLENNTVRNVTGTLAFGMGLLALNNSTLRANNVSDVKGGLSFGIECGPCNDTLLVWNNVNDVRANASFSVGQFQIFNGLFDVLGPGTASGIFAMDSRNVTFESNNATGTLGGLSIGIGAYLPDGGAGHRFLNNTVRDGAGNVSAGIGAFNLTGNIMNGNRVANQTGNSSLVAELPDPPPGGGAGVDEATPLFEEFRNVTRAWSAYLAGLHRPGGHQLSDQIQGELGTNVSAGVMLFNAPESSISDNPEANNNTGVNIGAGVWLQNSSDISVSNNTVRNNTGRVFGFGIALVNSTAVNVTNNMVAFNFGSIGAGVALLNTTFSQVRNNSAVNNTGNATVAGGDPATLPPFYQDVVSQVSPSQGIGFLLAEQSVNNTVANNTALNNTGLAPEAGVDRGAGIGLWGHSNNTTVSGNGPVRFNYHGIELNDSGFNKVEFNNASDNDGNRIRDDTNNVGDGIFLFRSSNNGEIRGNTARNNTAWGIHGENSVTGNTLDAILNVLIVNGLGNLKNDPGGRNVYGIDARQGHLFNVFFGGVNNETIIHSIIAQSPIGLKAVKSTDILVQDSLINDTPVAYLVDGSTVISLNTTFDINKTVVKNTSLLTVLQNLSLTVTDINNLPVGGANVSVADLFGQPVANATTDPSGRAVQPLLAFTQNASAKKFFTPHSVTVSRTGFETKSFTVNMTQPVSLSVQVNKTLAFPFGCFEATPALVNARFNLTKMNGANFSVHRHPGISSHPEVSCKNEIRSGAFTFNRTEFITDFGGLLPGCFITDVFVNRQGNVERLVPQQPCPPPPPPPGKQPLFSDTFSNDTNNDGIPDGWVPLAGTWALNNGSLCTVATKSDPQIKAIALNGRTFSGDVVMRADVQSLGGSPFLIPRLVDPAQSSHNLYAGGYLVPPTPPVSVDSFIFHEENATEQNNTFIPIPTGLLPVRSISVAINGSALDGFVNDQPVGSAAIAFSPKLTNGTIALASVQGDSCFDNVAVTDPPPSNLTFPNGCFVATPALELARFNLTFPAHVNLSTMVRRHPGISLHPAQACQNEIRAGAFTFNRTESISNFGGLLKGCFVTDVYTNQQGNVERLVPRQSCPPPSNVLFSDNFNDGQFLDGSWQVPAFVPPEFYPSASTGRLCSPNPTQAALLFTNLTFNKSVRVEADTITPAGYVGGFGLALKSREDTVAPHSWYGIAGFVISSSSIPSPAALLFTFLGGTTLNNTSAALSAVPSKLALEDNSGTLNLYADGSLVLSMPNDIPPTFTVETPPGPTPTIIPRALTADSGTTNISTEGGRVGLGAFGDVINNNAPGSPMCFDNIVVSCVSGTCPVASNPVNPDQLKVAPGFEVVFAVAAIVVMAYIVPRRGQGRAGPKG